MEGLLPMVYKSIKKNKTRRQYEHLSSGVAQSYSISDFYVTDHHGGIMNYSSSSSSISATTTKSTSSHHRRHNSVGEYAFGSFSTPAGRDITAATPPKRAALVRFRSHRMFMFSCVGGAA
ncbi:hypothetical protein TorRG33x02_292400 [Trema orientale]|uniref:Uncharacterized protein n=1 Tax=Trema orientale TaxID=63057 RepID=A0A2P5CA92_TREOI|nr:hypothetical protein TorRG33x02_292400 [Trema orientale]